LSSVLTGFVDELDELVDVFVLGLDLSVQRFDLLFVVVA
jgi:hypothetical protein